jgi:hypothetical protein
MDIAVWIVSGLLAAAYLAAGLMKALTPRDKLTQRLPWAEDYRVGTVRFIGIAELLGAVGLIVPWLTGIAPVLTPLAAVGLVAVQVLAIRPHIRRHERPAGNIVLLVPALFVAVIRFLQLGGIL